MHFFHDVRRASRECVKKYSAQALIAVLVPLASCWLCQCKRGLKAVLMCGTCITSVVPSNDPEKMYMVNNANATSPVCTTGFMKAL